MFNASGAIPEYSQLFFKMTPTNFKMITREYIPKNHNFSNIIKKQQFWSYKRVK